MITLLAALTLLTTPQQIEFESPYIDPDSVRIDSTMDLNSVEVNFTFYSNQFDELTSIAYSFDGIEGTFTPVKNNFLTLETTPGTHQLQSYFNENHYENYDMVHVEGQRRYFFSVHFTSSEMMILTEKPVIYLYPEQTTQVEVVLAPKGDLSFTYPAYNEGWNVKAHPNGKLLVDGNEHRYLFWESTARYTESQVKENEGFVISGSDVTAFLEEKLTIAGLNSEEQTDFITYWAPRMIAHKNVFIQFKFNEECDDFASLNVSPEPDESYRVYILWRPTSVPRIAPTPQNIPEMNREGFTLVEWGGQELPPLGKNTEL